MTNYQLYRFDFSYFRDNIPVVGIDEAGRGPLAGPVVVAACVLDLNNPIDGIDDSKKLTAKNRDRLYAKIVESALMWNVVKIDVDIIDRINILQATLYGMNSAAAQLGIGRAMYLIDGNMKVPGLDPQERIIKGDSKSASIAAASIIAKVTRDRHMTELAASFPEYGFDRHFGYPTKKHFENLEKFGATIHHRKSFAPVKKALERSSNL